MLDRRRPGLSALQIDVTKISSSDTLLNGFLGLFIGHGRRGNLGGEKDLGTVNSRLFHSYRTFFLIRIVFRAVNLVEQGWLASIAWCFNSSHGTYMAVSSFQGLESGLLGDFGWPALPSTG